MSPAIISATLALLLPLFLQSAPASAAELRGSSDDSGGGRFHAAGRLRPRGHQYPDPSEILYTAASTRSAAPPEGGNESGTMSETQMSEAMAAAIAAGVDAFKADAAATQPAEEEAPLVGSADFPAGWQPAPGCMGPPPCASGPASPVPPEAYTHTAEGGQPSPRGPAPAPCRSAAPGASASPDTWGSYAPPCASVPPGPCSSAAPCGEIPAAPAPCSATAPCSPGPAAGAKTLAIESGIRLTDTRLDMLGADGAVGFTEAVQAQAGEASAAAVGEALNGLVPEVAAADFPAARRAGAPLIPFPDAPSHNQDLLQSPAAAEPCAAGAPCDAIAVALAPTERKPAVVPVVLPDAYRSSSELAAPPSEIEDVAGKA